MKRMFYVYTLAVDGDIEPFYVGKGYGQRINEHERKARRGEQSFVCNKIRKAWNQGNEIVKTKVFVSPDEQECFLKESELIAFYGRRDIGTGCLVNQTDGGDGASGRVVSIHERQAKSKSMKGRARSAQYRENIAKAQTGHAVSEATRQKISDALKGRKLPSEVIKKVSASLRGRKHSDETKAKISKRHKGRTVSEKQKRSISDALSGRSRDESSVNKGAKYTREEAYLHVKTQISSGMQQVQYCAMHNIKPQTFCGWKRSPYVIDRLGSDGIEMPRRLTR
ncbi:MAG: hypothetical protein KDK04_21960 [Candidatus Competibacteraceae bacterium]|nr:hypothetical protein [Candidatus Competibacteraceae bacterium]